MLPAFDALTLGLMLLGHGSPYRDNPDAMVSAITPEAAAAVARLVEPAAGHIEPDTTICSNPAELRPPHSYLSGEAPLAATRRHRVDFRPGPVSHRRTRMSRVARSMLPSITAAVGLMIAA